MSKRPIVIDIDPHEDGVRCGECVDRRSDECDPQFDEDTGEYEIRGSACLAAESRHKRMSDGYKRMLVHCGWNGEEEISDGEIEANLYEKEQRHKRMVEALKRHVIQIETFGTRGTVEVKLLADSRAILREEEGK